MVCIKYKVLHLKYTINPCILCTVYFIIHQINGMAEASSSTFTTIPEDTLLKQTFCGEEIPLAEPYPASFPQKMKLYKAEFRNWVGDLVVPELWTVIPKNGQEVLTLVNWAHLNNYKIRPSGFMHTWAPVTISNHVVTHDEYPPEPLTLSNISRNVQVCKDKRYRSILVKTNETLTSMKIIKAGDPTSNHHNLNLNSKSAAVWVQSGATLENLLDFLEKEGYGINSHPATGEITMGGVLAIGGHGTGIQSRIKDEENVKDFSTTDSYGSVNSLVLEFTAIVWSDESKEYVMKTFRKNKDADFQAFLTGMGRNFVLDMILKVSPLKYLRCESRINIPSSELFANPELVKTPTRTISSIVEAHGRVESILFPFTKYPWIKYWSFEPVKPFFARTVTEPYNFPFSDSVSQTMSNIVSDITLGNWDMAPVLGDMQYAMVTAGLALTLSHDLWGPSKNLLLYIKSTTFKLGEMGACILTTRADLQRVMFESFSFYEKLMEEYQNNGKYPINGPMDVRVGGLDSIEKDFEGDDNTGDRSGEAPSHGISATVPFSGNKDFDICIWYTLLSIPGTPYRSEFFRRLETFFYTTFDGKYALARPEWSKGWAYSNEGAWRNEHMLRTTIPERFDNWQMTKDILNKYDPHSVFTNPFVNFLFG